MEYDFIHDAVTGNAKAKFSFEHQIIGPWLEVEIGQSTDKLTQILTAIDNVASRKTQEVLISGHEYSVLVNGDDVTIQANAALNGVEQLPEELSSDDMSFDNQEGASCGIDDFRTLLLSWAKFTKIH